MQLEATLELPHPRLVEGCFANVTAFTDDALYAATGVRIAFLERFGGTSAEPFDSLNVSPFLDDDEADVASNIQTVLDAFDVSDAALIQPRQIHEDGVVVCAAQADAPEAARKAREGADAVVVSCNRVAALLCFADCVPVILVSPKGSFSVVHAGWRGVMNGISMKALNELCKLDGVDAHEVNVYIGPHIRACHFEVSADLAERFAAAYGPSCLVDACHVSLSRALRAGLQAQGANPSRIVDVDICTVCEADADRRFYSYRATQGVCGRHGAFAIRG